MTDLDTLRRALRASPEPGRGFDPDFAPAFEAFDPAVIVAKGRRLRWRRRAVAAGSGVCLAAAVFGAMVGVGRLAGPSTGPARHTVAPIGPVGSRPRPVPSPRRDSAIPSASPTASPSPYATSRATPIATTPIWTSPTSAAGTPSASASEASAGSAGAATPSSDLTSTPTGTASATPTPTPTTDR
jgi:hypothetical protein